MIAVLPDSTGDGDASETERVASSSFSADVDEMPSARKSNSR